MTLKNTITIIISIIFLSSTTLAECTKAVTYLKDGTPSPCNGYLFTPEKEASIYRELEQGKLYKQLSDKTEEQNNILQQRVDSYMKNNEELRQYNQSQELKSDLQKIGYFVLGALVIYGGFKIAERQ